MVMHGEKDSGRTNAWKEKQRQTAKEMGGLYLRAFANVSCNSKAICKMQDSMQDSIQGSHLCSHVLERISF